MQDVLRVIEGSARLTLTETVRAGALIKRNERRSTTGLAASMYVMIEDEDLPSSLNAMQALSEGKLDGDVSVLNLRRMLEI